MPVIFIVISNSVYGWIKAGQKTKFDKRYFSVDFTRTDHSKVASAFGLKTWKVEKPIDLNKTIWEQITDGQEQISVGGKLMNSRAYVACLLYTSPSPRDS